MTTFRCVSLLAAVVLASCGIANANTTLFYDDFQSDTAGTMPNDIAGDLNPAIGTGDVGVWAIAEDPVSAVQVWNNATPNLQNDIAGSNKYVKTERPLPADVGNLNARGWTEAATSNQIVEYTASVWVPLETDDPNRALILAWGNAWSTPGFGLLMGGGGVDYRSGSGGWASTGLSFTNDTWRDVKITANLATKTYTVTVEGNAAPFTTAAWDDALTSIDAIQNGTGYAGQRVYFDNVSLTMIPEPSAIALLLTGLLGLLAYAWRRWK